MRTKRRTLERVWEEVLDFNNDYFPGWRGTKEVQFSNALAGEVGEVCNSIKHRDGGGTNRKAIPSKYDVMEELADVFIYLELLVETMGLDSSSLVDAITSKIRKNKKRMKAEDDR